MKAIWVRDHDGPTMELRETPAPAPGPGEILIAVHTASVVYADTLIVAGRYQSRHELPFIPGSECSGVVDGVGPGVKTFRRGDRVIAMGFVNGRILGAFAERLVCPARNAILAPDCLSLREAALFRSNYETARYGLMRAGLRPGETLLVLGGGGGTGFAAVTIGSAMGARVVASVSSAARGALARAGGASAVVDIRNDAWREQIIEATGGEDVDVVYDPVGGQATERAFRTLGWGGRHLVVGFAAGAIPNLPTNLPLHKGASLVGVNLLRFIEAEPDQAAANAKAVLDLITDRQIMLPPLAEAYEMADAAAALASVTRGEAVGRIVLAIDAAPDPFTRNEGPMPNRTTCGQFTKAGLPHHAPAWRDSNDE